MVEVDGKYRVWTKKVGSGKIKVLTLHGGPGATHEYFECFEDFLPPAGIEFYYYDQLGSAYSDQPDDKSLWTIDRFRGEVEQVRQALGLENFYLYGQSWGGMLAIEYALAYQKHLKGLVISSMKAMFEQVYTRHLCRLDPWPDPVARTFKHLAAPVYNTMQGPNEFVVTGTFKDWDRWKDLPEIRVPTLLMGARYDEMNPEDIRKMGRLIPRSRVVICENGSHLAMWDDQEAYFRGLIGFLKDVEAGRFGKAA
jgi:proline iminopeptidase